MFFFPIRSSVKVFCKYKQATQKVDITIWFSEPKSLFQAHLPAFLELLQTSAATNFLTSLTSFLHVDRYRAGVHMWQRRKTANRSGTQNAH